MYKGWNKESFFTNKRKIDSHFRESIMPRIREIEVQQGNGKDLPLRRMAYIYYIDSLHKNNSISSKQAGTYIIPEDLIKDYRK